MTLREKAMKQVEAADIYVKDRKAEFLLAEEELLKAEERVRFLKDLVMKAVGASIELQYVVSWLDRQEEGGS